MIELPRTGKENRGIYTYIRFKAIILLCVCIRIYILLLYGAISLSWPIFCSRRKRENILYYIRANRSTTSRARPAGYTLGGGGRHGESSIVSNARAVIICAFFKKNSFSIYMGKGGEGFKGKKSAEILWVLFKLPRQFITRCCCLEFYFIFLFICKFK